VEQLITTIENEGVIEKEEAELVHNALSFDETEIKNIMKKIENVKYIRSDMKDEEVINYLLQYQHTRIPVYDTSKNAFIGYLLTIDILGSVISSQNKNIDCFKHLKFIHEIEENETLNYALKLMQRTFQPFLSVINKKKETIGILTSEQISEAIVGEIYNEYDKLNDYRYINDFTYLVNGNFNASEFFKKAFEIVIEDKQITFDGYVKSIFKFDNEANVTNIFKNDNFEVLILKKYDGVFDYEIKNLK
jgi:CBS domain containing-hemolysin-like protein